MGEDVRPVRRALFSVHDKTGLDSLARALLEKGADIFATDSTARFLAGHGLTTASVSDLTGFPSLLGGRVKTLHPKVFAGVLSRGDEDAGDLAKLGAPEFDLVAVNLYPFEQAAYSTSAPTSKEDLIELVDIGGSTLLRAAAKNHARVAVLSSPSQYPGFVSSLAARGGTTASEREALAVEAFERSARYEATVYRTMRLALVASGSTASPFPTTFTGPFDRVGDLRYGENSHVRAAFYREPGWVEPAAANAERLSGRALSFNNLLDLDAALELAKEFHSGACVVVKHTNPCGVALSDAPRDAFTAAHACDPLSAYGGVVAFNRPVDDAAAGVMKTKVLDGVIAPGFSPGAVAILGRKKKGDFLVLRTGEFLPRSESYDMKRITGGLLVQERDLKAPEPGGWKIVSRRPPAPAETAALTFAWLVCKHVKSNCVVISSADRTLGIGAGQMSRVDAVAIATRKAGAGARGGVMASDAYFPFRDGVDDAARAGVTAIVHPGGSIRDAEIVAAADEHGMAMVTTGVRQFRH